MKRTVNKVEPSKVEVVIEFDSAAWVKALEKNLKILAKDVKVDGFRPGKAPEEVLRRRIDTEKLYNKAINDLLPEAYEAALKEEKLNPLSRPTIDVTKVSDTELTIKITVLLVPEFTLGKYKGLGLKRPAIKVTPEEVTKEINTILSNNAELVLKEGAAVMGDTVVFDFEGFLNGVPFDGGKAENYSLELGSKQFIPGFEEGMVGIKAGEAKDLNVKFPEKYQAENLAGKDVVFKVKVHEIKAKKMPLINAALFETLKLKDVKNEVEFKEHVRKDLLKEKEQEAEGQYFTDLLNAVVKSSKIQLPHDAIHHHMDDLQEDLLRQLEQRKQTFEQYLTSLGLTEEKYNDQLHERAERNLLQSLVLDRIAAVEKIEVTDQTLDFEMMAIATQYKMDVARVKEILAPQMSRFRAEIREKYIREFLLKNNA